MSLKVLILISLLFGSSIGQSINCVYINTVIFGTPHYTCQLTINNPIGFDDFTSINGTHLENRTNSDVTAILRTLDSRTINFPEIICSQFPNTVLVDYSYMNVVAIGENTLSRCSNLEWIRFWRNNIEGVHERAFANNSRLTYIDLDNNLLQTLPENVFNGLNNLLELELSNNPFEVLPSGLFRPLTSLRMLLLISNRLTELNPQWFETLRNLEAFSIYNNSITSLPQNVLNNLSNLVAFEISRNPLGDLDSNTFQGLSNLEELYMSRIGITEINPGWFTNLRNLEVLYIYSNNYTSINEGVFDTLTSLLVIDIGDNRLTDTAIPGALFRNTTQLLWLINDLNLVQNLNPQWFESLSRLVWLNLNFNQVAELPIGIFAAFNQLREIELWWSNIKTINRDAFGALSNMYYVDFDNNNINAIDLRFFADARPLMYFYVWGNLCTGERFYNFTANMDRFLPRLALCTRNFEFTVDTATEPGANPSFFAGQYPGIQVRVNTDSAIHIALTPFNFLWNPTVEIIIGADNNTVSRIIKNQSTNVVTVPTPNIIRNGQWSGFRITWSNHVILVHREGQTYPFMAYTLECIFPVNFYGLSSSQSRAVWSIQPVEAEILPTEV